MSDKLPDWWQPLLRAVATARTEDFTRLVAPARGGRRSAVLVLFGEQPATGPDVLILQRAAAMRNHAGQPAFPGGAADPGDVDAAGTALREAHEEVGLDPDSVRVLASLPELWIPVSNFRVTPVLAWWQRPHQVYPCQPAEVARVARLPVAELVDPANRLRVRHPSGWIGPAFDVRGMLVWGFTAGVLSVLLTMAGWDRPWSPDRVVDWPAPGVADPDAPLLDAPVPGPGGPDAAASGAAVPDAFPPRPGRASRPDVTDEVNR